MTVTSFSGEALRERYADDPIALAMIDYIEQLLAAQPWKGYSYGNQWWDTNTKPFDFTVMATANTNFAAVKKP